VIYTMANFEHLENLTLQFFQLYLAACGTIRLGLTGVFVIA
jgi:hypothetical protein